MPLAQPTPVHPRRTTRSSPTVVVSAATVPVLVGGQFAMLAVVPVLLVLVGAFRDARLRAFRGWAIALAAAYAVPLVLRATGPDPGLSLSKSMGPVLTVALVGVSTVVAIAAVVLARRHDTSPPSPA